MANRPRVPPDEKRTNFTIRLPNWLITRIYKKAGRGSAGVFVEDAIKKQHGWEKGDEKTNND